MQPPSAMLAVDGGAPHVPHMDDADGGVSMPSRSTPATEVAGSPAQRAATAGALAAGASGAAGGAGAPNPACAPSGGKPPETHATASPVRAQDPAIVEHQGEYFLFATAAGIAIRRSKDLLSWRDAGSVFFFLPGWIGRQVPGVTELTAPALARIHDKLHLYYGVSTPGSNRACIGHATSDSPTGTFSDKGALICSNAMRDTDDWNAADPAVVQEDGKSFLVLGSFWSGIKLIELDDEGKRAGDSLVALAARPRAGNAVSAPYIVRHCDHYYLFVSFDRCCDGANSTSQIMVGRSEQLRGPYLDRQGVRMLDGGGSPLVRGDSSWHGPGQLLVLDTPERSYELHHAYFAGESAASLTKGAAYLRISELSWDGEGWPVSGGP